MKVSINLQPAKVEPQIHRCHVCQNSDIGWEFCDRQQREYGYVKDMAGKKKRIITSCSGFVDSR